MTGWKKAAARFGVLTLAAVSLQLLPLLFGAGEAGEALYLIHLYAVIPLCAFFIPLWAGRGGLHPLLGFFPVGGALLLMRAYESPGVGCLCLLLSLVGCVAGQELLKRSAEGKNAKERKHGRK